MKPCAESSPPAAMPLLSAEGIKKVFHVHESGRRRALTAVDGVNLAVYPGETLGLVGESGCGKSTLGKIILGLINATAGRIVYRGEMLAGPGGHGFKSARRDIQIIFQDPYASLNPRLNVGGILAEPFIIHRVASRREVEGKVIDLLRRVGLSPGDRWRYPHEFSGGQRQRIGIARALALNPKLVVADEPVSSLDVSVQAQIINLLRDLQRETGAAYLFISHDLSVIRHVSERVAVMYLGKIVESAATTELFIKPLHPYTEALLAAVPDPAGKRRQARAILGGDMPSPTDPPLGCRFHTRCPIRGRGCDTVDPCLREISPGRLLACHYRGI